MLQKQFNNGEVAPGAGERQRGVVVVGGRPVDVGALRYQELDRAQVAGARSLHQRRAPSFRFVLLKKER